MSGFRDGSRGCVDQLVIDLRQVTFIELDVEKIGILKNKVERQDA